MPRHGIGAENPINDRAQVLFVLVFLIVWGIDSFLLRYNLNLLGLNSLIVSVPLGLVSFIIGVYFVRKSESVVFSNTEGKVIDSGVYGWVRHPMYLGSLLILLGFSIATLSLLSFVAWIVFFIFLDRMASYEEKDLAKILGQQYFNYQKKVSKWIPYKKYKPEK
jgi:protein-S-isoprenylcysteine O-methyltransferase Ste14